jgi:hypothetical protein
MPSLHSLRAAFSLAVLLGGLAVGETADAQSGLPACPANIAGWHNCWGTHTWPDGRKYEGAWKDDKLEGQGTYTWPNGEKYVGAFKDGKREGQGTHTWPDGAKYEGAWKDDKREGQGTFTWPDGAIYSGTWKDDKHEGQGTTTWPSGAIYSGTWKDGKREGQGNYTWPDGMKYVGAFEDDNREGQGTQTWPDGEKYEGAWKDDKREGQGTYTYADGWMYVGAWKDSKREGQGTLILPSGTNLVGIWANDKYIRSAPVPVSAAHTAPPAAPKSTSGSGSAFRIGAGQFVTNHHVVDGCTTLKIDGNSGARVVASDPTRDLALVSIANDSGPIASIRTTRIQLNESITAAGFPLDGAFTGIAVTNGSISRLSGLRGDTGEVQISAPVQPGNSGGPLLDVAGNVIGVVSSKLNALKLAVASGDIPQNVNFAINGAALRAFLDAKSVNYKEVSNERELTGVQIAARASAFTVLIECRQ